MSFGALPIFAVKGRARGPTAGRAATSAPAAKLGQAARLFGYDVFISFALGPPPRGTQSYASDLARRLRELDFSVFFSEDEAPPGDRLDETLRRALLRSKALVVVANREALEDPRWVRVEVEEFRGSHPTRPVISISVDGALEDAHVLDRIDSWLPASSRIWLDEAAAAVRSGIASDAVVARLALAPKKLRSNLLWRWVLMASGGLVSGLALAAVIGWWNSASNAREAERQQLQAERNALEAGRQQSLAEAGQALAREKAAVAALEAERARRERQRAETEAERARRERERAITQLRRAVSLQLSAQSRAMLAGLRQEDDFRALASLITAHRVAPGVEVDGEMLDALALSSSMLKVVTTDVPVTSVAYAPDGRSVVSAHADGTIRFWDAASGQALSSPLAGHREGIRRVVFSPDGSRLATAGNDRLVGLWDARRKTLSALLKGHESGVGSVAFSPDGTRLVSGSSDDTLRIWNASTGAPVGHPIFVHIRSEMYMGGGTVDGVTYTPDGARIVSASGTVIGGSDTVRIWDAQTGNRLNTLHGHAEAVKAVVVSPDGAIIVSAGYDKTLRVWNADTGHALGRPLVGHEGAVVDLAFAPGGGQVASAGRDKSIRVWDVSAEPRLSLTLLGHDGGVNAVAFSPDGTRLVSGGADATLRFWDVVETATLGRVIRAHDSAVRALAFSPDGSRLATAAGGTVRIWDVRTGNPVGGPLQGHMDLATAVAFSPDGTRIVSGGGGGLFSGLFGSKIDFTLRQWRVEDGQPVAEPVEGHQASVRGLSYSPDGQQIISFAADGTLTLWDLHGGARRRFSVDNLDRGIREEILAARFSTDGKRIASAGRDGQFQWWSAATGKRTSPPVGKKAERWNNWLQEVPRSAAISWDGRRVAFGREGQPAALNAITLWDTTTGQRMLPVLQGHAKEPTAIAFGPDDGLLVSGSGDGMVIAWNATVGKALGSPLRGHPGSITAVAVSPAGTHFASADDKGSLRIWPAPPLWPQALCEKLARNMSRQEWAAWVSPAIDYVVQCPGLPVPPSVPRKTSNAASPE